MVTVRAFRSTDLEATLRLAGRLTEGVAGWLDRDAVAAAARGWARDSIGAIGRNAALFVAVGDDGALVGFVSVAGKAHFTGEQHAYIGELAVARAAEGSGVGRMLVQAAERWAAERGLRTITLETGAANERARRFYQRLGYKEESVALTRVLR